jgi:hypothetical protein
MVTITEDYISFETAKLLKDKGFDNISSIMYKENGEICINPKSVSSWRLKYWYPCLTHQMAMKWLREVHNLYIDIRININNSLYSFKIYSVGVSGARAFTEYRIKSYEIACEEAIKYCLENLI